MTAALLVFCDCELVCALATERPSPVRAIVANGINSQVKDPLPICRITYPQVTPSCPSPTYERPELRPPWPVDLACSNSALGRCLLPVANIRQISEFLTMPPQPLLRARHLGVGKILTTFTISASPFLSRGVGRGHCGTIKLRVCLSSTSGPGMPVSSFSSS